MLLCEYFVRIQEQWSQFCPEPGKHFTALLVKTNIFTGLYLIGSYDLITQWNTVSRIGLLVQKLFKVCSEQLVIFVQCLFCVLFDINGLLNPKLCSYITSRRRCRACLQALADVPCTDLRTETWQLVTTVTHSPNVTEGELKLHIIYSHLAVLDINDSFTHRSCIIPSTCRWMMARWININYVCVWKTTPVQSE